MELFHFTASRFIDSIRREGLNKGGVLELQELGAFLHRGFVWLTANESFYTQGWSTMLGLPYDRSEFRMTVDIPDSHADRLTRWLTFCEQGRVNTLTAAIANMAGDPENWWLYEGAIPPRWIKSFDRKLIITSGQSGLRQIR